MSGPDSPDSEKQAESDAPDLDRAYRGDVEKSRISDEEKEERIPDPEE